MKKDLRTTVISIIIVVIAAFGIIQYCWVKSVTGHIYNENRQMIEHAVFASWYQDGTEKPLDTVDSLLASNLKKWGIEVPYKLTIYKSTEDGSRDFVACFDNNGGKELVNPVVFSCDLVPRQNIVAEIEYDNTVALHRHISPFMTAAIISNIAILLSLILAVAYVRRKRVLMGAQKSFVNVVAHNLRNPLAVAHAAAEALSGNDAVINDKASSDLVNITIRQLDTLDSQVETVLRNARTGKLYDEKSRENIRLSVFSEDLIKSFKMSHPEAVFDIDIDPSHRLNAVPEELSSVLTILVDNALKYSEGTPHVSIFTKASKKGKISLTVKDSGIGFSKKEKKRAFYEYFRGQRGRTKDTSGFGLGLYYVKQIADENRWKVSIDSAEGAGAAITISQK